MRQHTGVSHARHNGHSRTGLPKRLGRSLSSAADRIRGNTNRVLSKSLRNVKAKTKKLPKEIDRIVVSNRYRTIGAAVITGLCLGYFLKK